VFGRHVRGRVSEARGVPRKRLMPVARGGLNNSESLRAQPQRTYSSLALRVGCGPAAVPSSGWRGRWSRLRCGQQGV